MQSSLFAAGALALLVGAAHSVLGEILIFRRMRGDGIVPTRGAPVLPERHVRILWATWHATTVFGCTLAAVLLRSAFAEEPPTMQAFVENAIAFGMCAAAALVLIGTRGRHPGWIGLLGVAALLWLG